MTILTPHLQRLELLTRNPDLKRQVSRATAALILVLIASVTAPRQVEGSIRTIILAVKKAPSETYGKLYWYKQLGGPGQQNNVATGGLVDNGPTGMLASAGSGLLFVVDVAGDLVTQKVELTNSSTLTVKPPQQYVRKEFGRHGYTQLISSGRGALFALDRKGDLYYYSYTVTTTADGPYVRLSSERYNVANGWNSFGQISHLADDSILTVYPDGTANRYPYHTDKDTGIAFQPSVKLESPINEKQTFPGFGDELFSVDTQGILKRRTNYALFPKVMLGGRSPSRGWSGFSQILSVDSAYVDIRQQAYTVSVKTANVSGAGTDMHVGITLEGVNGLESGPYYVNKLVSGNVLEKGQTDTFSVTPPQNQGAIRKIFIKKGGALGQTWHLEQITVTPTYSPPSIFRPASTKMTPKSETVSIERSGAPVVPIDNDKAAENVNLISYDILVVDGLNTAETLKHTLSQKKAASLSMSEESTMRTKTSVGLEVMFAQGSETFNFATSKQTFSFSTEFEYLKKSTKSGTVTSEAVTTNAVDVVAQKGTVVFHIWHYSAKGGQTRYRSTLTDRLLVATSIRSLAPNYAESQTLTAGKTEANDRIWNRNIAHKYVVAEGEAVYKATVDRYKREGLLKYPISSLDALTKAP